MSLSFFVTVEMFRWKGKQQVILNKYEQKKKKVYVHVCRDIRCFQGAMHPNMLTVAALLVQPQYFQLAHARRQIRTI